MKKIIGLMLIGLLLVTGCTSTPVVTEPIIEPTEPTEPTEEVIEPSEPVTSPTEEVTPGDSTYSDITYIEDQGIPDIPEGFGLYGSSAEFEGVFPGWSGTVPVTIVNGQDKDRLFVLSLNSPTKVKEGFEPFPQEYFYWITISEPEITVPAGETYQVPVTLEMPSDSDYTGKHAEVRIRVEDTTQEGFVQIALETKWFIITAD